MHASSPTEWIAQFLRTDPPRSKSLVMTIFGDSIAPHGGSAWLGSLIDLLAPFGVNDRLLRTSAFRLVQEGWLVASRDGRRSSYAILAEARPRFERANRRIYAPLDRGWDGSWTMLLGGTGAVDAPERTALRKELLWEGFAHVAPGLFAYPGAPLAELDELLARLDLREKVFVWRAAALPAPATRPLGELAAEAWDLSEVSLRYVRFLEQFASLSALLEQGAALGAGDAFMVRSLLIHAYRRVQLHDPLLPVALLPAQWPGAQAYALARALYRRTQAAAEEFVLAVLRREDAATPPAEAGFYERFGGLN